MQKSRNDYWRSRFERVQAENQVLKERLVSSKKENRDLQKGLRSRDRLFDSIPAGILLEQEGRIVAANREFLEGLGYALEEVIGRRLLDFVPLDLKKVVRDLHDKRVAGKKVPSQYELDLLKQDGERRCLEVRVNKIRHNGRRAFLTNLTWLEKRKREERERIEFQKREALMTMVSGLTGKLSQHVKVLSENVQRIKEMADPAHGALTKRLEHIESVSNDTLNAVELLKKLLASKDDSAADVLVDLRKAVKAAISITHPMMKEVVETRKQEINLKTYLRSVPPVQGDPDEIRDLMVSLIRNAIEAMPRGGDLYVTTEENAGYAYIYIQDSGLGIPDGIKDRILDPFFTTKGKDRLGLGLSLSYAIVKRHKGDMEFSSEKDQGTTFIVRLPTVREEETSNGRAVKRRIRNAHILIIEPEEILNQILSQVFVSRGHRVVPAYSSLEVRQMLNKKKFDLILVDSLTPDIENDAVIKKMRKMNGNPPMALITNEPAEDLFRAKKESGFDLIITKPLDMDTVLKDVEAVLRARGGVP
jgi:PAS domain S-box-containing protein